MGYYTRIAILWIALAGSLLTGLQAGFVFFKGELFCFNEGCKVASSLVKIPDLYVHVAGFLYFQFVYWLAFYYVPGPKRGFLGSESRDRNNCSLLAVVLLAGFVIEGILISYQLFVSNVWCAYCVAIFATILLLNLVYGGTNLITGLFLFAIQVLAFSVLNFQGTTVASEGSSLDKGTVAVRGCDKPTKRLYLVFSESCPHCISVLETLRTCVACEVHFNPIAAIKPELLPGLSLIANYEPEVNRNLLKLLGINAIPVLIVEEPMGLEFIKGQQNIVSYLNQHCATSPHVSLDNYYRDPFAASNNSTCSVSSVECDQTVLSQSVKR